MLRLAAIPQINDLRTFHTMMVEQLHCIVREDQKPSVVASSKLMVNELLDLMA